MTEFEKLKAWYEKERDEKGLKRFHVTLSNMLGFTEKVFENPAPFVAMLPAGVTLEDVCRELNGVNVMLDDPSRVVERGDVF